MKKPLLLSLVILGQLSYLGGSIGYHQARINAGTRILLETAPVDPFSMFRGRYVALSYKISRIPITLVRDGTRPLVSGEIVYVQLARNDEVWEPVGVSVRRPAEGVFLRGQVDSAYGGEVRLRYGLESFFLSEGSADFIDRNARRAWRSPSTERESLRVEVAVARDGTSYARKLFWRGREYR